MSPRRDVKSSLIKKLKCIFGDTPYQQCQTTTTQQQSIMTTNPVTINIDDANLAEILKKIIADADLTVGDLFDDQDILDHVHDGGMPIDEIFAEDEILGCGCVIDAMEREREELNSDGWAKVDEKDEEIEELEKKVAELKEKVAGLEKSWDSMKWELDEKETELMEAVDAVLRVDKLKDANRTLKKKNAELEKKVAEHTEQMRFLDPNGKPCDRCNEPVCYEGNEGKVSENDGEIICGECYSREVEEAKHAEKYTLCESCRRNCYTGGEKYPDGYTCDDCEEDEEDDE